MTPRASGGDRQDRIDRPLRIDHRAQADRQILFARIDVAHRAVLQIQRLSGWTERRKQRARKIVVAAAETNDDVRPIERLHIYAVVNPVY